MKLFFILGLVAGGLFLVGTAKGSGGTPLPDYKTPPRSQAEANERLAKLVSLRPDANSGPLFQADGYARHFFYLDKSGEVWTDAPQKWNSMGHIENRYDEFGRWVPTAGVSGDPMGAVLTAAGIALPFVPGVGPAASAALAAAVALGKGESLKDAALKAVRAALPLGGQVAFDLGIAVASGDPVDKAALQATLGQIPGGKEAYEAGLDAWKQVKG